MWDRDRIYQLLANLVGNAVQHGEPRSPIDLRINGGKVEVLIEVTNRGGPIPPGVLPFIFEAFRRGRTSHRSQSQRLGLGLLFRRESRRGLSRRGAYFIATVVLNSVFPVGTVVI